MRKKHQQRKASTSAIATGSAPEVGQAPTPGGRWRFRVLSMVAVPLVLLVAAEGLLRLLGYGYSTDFFTKRDLSGRTVWTDNPDFGRRFFPAGRIRYPHPFTMPAVKAPGTIRIFVLGESAAMGDPDSKFGFSRMLEVLLRERLPGRHIEVVNTAMVAINSHAILPIGRECGRHQGDLWIVYMGNNEMVGPFGSASVFGAQTPGLRLVRAGLWLKTTRLGQLFDTALDSVHRTDQNSSEWAGMEMMADRRVAYDAPATERVYRHFERNLTDLLTAGADAGVPMVLCTVPTNLKDCAPFASLHRSGLAAADLAEWQKSYDTGIAFQNKSNLVEAEAAFNQATRFDPDFAELAFRRGECGRLMAQNAEFASFFREARDKDALQFRADSRINETIRRCSARFANQRVELLDAENLFAASSPQKIPGAEYFYEHVHLTPEGNYLLGRAVAEDVLKALSLSANGQWLSQSECLRLLGFTDWNRYDALNAILERIQRAPFTNQMDHAQQVERLNEQLARYRLATKPAQVRREIQQVSPLVSRYPDDADLHWNLAALFESIGEMEPAEEQWREVLRLQPQDAWPRFNLGKVLEARERLPEASTFYLEGLRIHPDYFPARYALATLYLKMDRLAEAIHHLNLALRQRPRSIEARLALGEALRRGGRTAEAQTQLREVLRLDPQNQSAAAQLSRLPEGK